jgi:flagellar basal-body rod protein FlgB
MNDVTIGVLQQSIRGLAARQRALADNIANLETPGYRSKVVDFEESLAAARKGGSPFSSSISERRSMDPTGLNGNNVNLDDETIKSTETGLSYQFSIEALNAKYRLLRTAIRGQL